MQSHLELGAWCRGGAGGPTQRRGARDPLIRESRFPYTGVTTPSSRGSPAALSSGADLPRTAHLLENFGRGRAEYLVQSHFKLGGGGERKQSLSLLRIGHAFREFPHFASLIAELCANASSSAGETENDSLSYTTNRPRFQTVPASRQMSNSRTWLSPPARGSTFISLSVFIKLFRKGRFPHKSFNVFFILVRIKDKLTDLWRN